MPLVVTESAGSESKSVTLGHRAKDLSLGPTSPKGWDWSPKLSIVMKRKKGNFSDFTKCWICATPPPPQELRKSKASAVKKSALQQQRGGRHHAFHSPPNTSKTCIRVSNPRPMERPGRVPHWCAPAGHGRCQHTLVGNCNHCPSVQLLRPLWGWQSLLQFF